MLALDSVGIITTVLQGLFLGESQTMLGCSKGLLQCRLCYLHDHTYHPHARSRSSQTTGELRDDCGIVHVACLGHRGKSDFYAKISQDFYGPVGQEFIIDVARLIRGFVIVGPYRPGGPWLFFYSVRDYTFIVKGCLYPVQTLILDGVVVSTLVLFR